MTREELKTKMNVNVTWWEEDDYNEAIKLVNEYLDKFESDLRAEFQKKIAEINLEHDSMVCGNCEFSTDDETAVPLLLCGCTIGICKDIANVGRTDGCNKFKKKQQCTQKPNS